MVRQRNIREKIPFPQILMRGSIERIYYPKDKEGTKTAVGLVMVLGKFDVQSINYDNGLIQQYFPKGYDFRSITPERLAEVEHEINDRHARHWNTR
jgi:hypothetical protein